MLMQLSVLRVFQAILSDKAFRKQEGAGEVTHLATQVTRNLCARLAPDNPDEGKHTHPADIQLLVHHKEVTAVVWLQRLC